jgi:H+/Cl- antiporter ClcA
MLWIVEKGTELVYIDLPSALGIADLPWWWAAGLLLIGAGAVALAKKLPGKTGPGPLTGFHFDLPLVMVPSVLAAALATLIFGIVLGPEAPLIVLGSAIGAIVTRNADSQTRKAMMLLGGVAAIGAVFGNPFVTAFMILEFAAIGMVPAMLITPVLLALASSYVVQIGIWGIPGFGVHSLSVPGLPSYSSIAAGDLVTALVVSVLAGAVAILARKGGIAFERFASTRVTRGLFIGAIVTAAVVGISSTIFDVAPQLILFSGSAGMSSLIEQTSIVSILVILLGKALAYAMALGGGFRGGPIFPATFLGVAVAVLTVAIFPSDSVSALAAAAIAASAAAMIKLPATSALLGMVLIVGAGPDVAPFAILGAVIGFGIRIFADSKDQSVRVTASEAEGLLA